MGAMSRYLEQNVIMHLFRTSSYTKPTHLAIALCSNVPVVTDTGSLSVGGELANSGANARQTLDPADANWSPGTTDGITGNSGGITFTAATANWGWISGVAICDSTTYGGGNMLFYGALALPKLISSGDQFKLNISDILIQLQ